ncbi:MAG: potassium transporter TrkG [Candidatus Cloacimonadota bacterium]
MISGYVGSILTFISALMLIPLIVVLCYQNESGESFPIFLMAFLIFLVGILFKIGGRKAKQEALDLGESSIVVVLTWLVVTLLSAIPFVISCKLSFSQAYFEAVSGWTTTGLSMLDLNAVSKTILFYRGWTQFLGGAGMAIIVIASLTGIKANQLYSAEGKGNLITPNVSSSSRIVVSLYTGYLIYGVIAYLLAGMGFFDALIHCFTAISTGGFGNYATSMAYFDSPVIELITISLMILGGMNFVTSYLLVKRRMLSVVRNGEIRLFSVLSILSICFIFFFSASRLYTGLERQIRVSAFEAISALTTTGFSITNYNQPYWNDSSVLVLILLMLVGGGACSTAGGIKQYRVYLMYKSIMWQIHKSIIPKNAVYKPYVWDNEQKDYVGDSKLLNVSNYVVLYLVVYLVGVLVISSSINPLTGTTYGMREALFEFASSLGTVGLSVGLTTTSTPVHILWIMSSSMLLGRLEFFIVILALAKLFKDLFTS